MTESATNVAALPQPLPYATINGRQVRLLAFGDVPGKSPAFLTINEEGVTAWESQSKVRITDPHCLPLTSNVTTR